MPATAACKERLEYQIKRLVDERIAAVRAKDVAASLANLDPDVLSFDVVNPLCYVGADSSRKRTQAWFAAFAGPIDYEMRDLDITSTDDLAFAHGLSHVSGAMTSGTRLDMWWRTTLCFKKSAGKWLITHEHNSVPFNPQNGKASLDLKP